MTPIANHRLEFAAWEWAEHRQPGNLIVHIFSNAALLSFFSLLLAKIHLPFLSLGADSDGLSLAWPYLAILLLYHARLDLLSASMAAVVLAFTTGAWRGEFYFEHDHSFDSVLALLGGYAVAGLSGFWGHQIFHDHDGKKHMSGAPGGNLLRIMEALVTGWPVYMMIWLLRSTGYRSTLRERLEAQALTYYRTAHDREWHNWAQTEHCRPQSTWYPRNVLEVREIVELAAREGKRIRVVGTSYSWPPLAASEEFMVCLRLLGDIEIEHGDRGPRVWVGAGVVGRELNEVLERAGYCLPSNVVMETVSFGGMTSVGAHGSGWDQQTLSDMVDVVELIDGRGRLRCFRCGKDSDEIMNAVRVSLGMYGVVVRVALRIQRSFNVRLCDSKISMAQMLDTLPDRVSQHDYYDVFWFPGTQLCWTRAWDRVDAPISPWRPHLPWSISTTRDNWGRTWAWLQSVGFNVSAALCRRWPALTPHVMSASNLTVVDHTRVVHIHDASHYRSAIEIHRLGCMEFGFAVDADDMAGVRQAWRDVEDVIAMFAKRGRHPINMTVNMRFTAGSSCLLAAGHGNAHTCFIEVLGDPRQHDWLACIAEIGRRWMALPNARPHWPKQHRELPGMLEHLSAVVGPDLGRVLELRDELDLDPNRMFVNAYIEWLSGAASKAAAKSGLNPASP
jgi:hypothetical protein